MAEPHVRCDRLATREITGNLTATTDTIRAWYVLPPQSWSFLSDGHRADVVVHAASRLADLVGTRDVHLRVTSRPYPVALWAQHLHETTQRTAPGPLPGCDGNRWADHLLRVQAHVRGYSLADKEVYVGVPVNRRGVIDRAAERFIGRGVSDRERKQVDRRVNEVTKAVAGPGFNARPATTREVEWLLHRSVGLLMPAPLHMPPVDDPRWEPDDMAAFTDGIDYETRPGGKTVKVIDTRWREPVERWVAVLTLGRIGPVDPVASEPWMQRADLLPFPVEWSARMDVLSGPQAKAEVDKALRVLRDQQKHYLEHELDVPLDLGRKVNDARRISDEMHDGDRLVSTRVYGWWRLAVAGTTEDECLDRVRRVRDLYANTQFTVEHPRGQYGLVREFIPGERLAQTAYRRRLPVTYAAAALPQITATVGDRVGDYLGYTTGTSRRAVMFDPHYGPEVREVSGFVPVVGEPGAGKSVLMGWVAYHEARRGVTTTILDPAGPLAGLTRLPEFAGSALHVDLLNGEPGSLNPATVIPDPRRDGYPDDDKWRQAVTLAAKNRKVLMLDVALQLLPAQIAALPQTRTALGRAIRTIPGDRSASLTDVLAALRATGDTHAADLAADLHDISELPQAALFFPPDEHVYDRGDGSDVTLLVLTMEGVVLPDTSIPREDWTVQEQLAVPLLHLATHFATRRVYGLPRRQRKFIGLDEVGQMGRWGSGRALFTGLARGSRKENAAVFASSQNPADVLGLKVENYVATAFVGRIEDDTIAGEALRLLRVPVGIGYEAVIHGLSPQAGIGGGRRTHREFIMRDVMGNREVIRVDPAHYPHVLAALDSTPTAPNPALTLAGATA